MLTAVWRIVAGIIVITFGFFGGHSIVSSWVGRRAGGAEAQAASLYLFVYYLGSSVAGASGGCSSPTQTPNAHSISVKDQ